MQTGLWSSSSTRFSSVRHTAGPAANWSQQGPYQRTVDGTGTSGPTPQYLVVLTLHHIPLDTTLVLTKAKLCQGKAADVIHVVNTPQQPLVVPCSAQLQHSPTCSTGTHVIVCRLFCAAAAAAVAI